MPTDWITMTDPCTKLMKSQVQEELTAAMTYLAMVRRCLFAGFITVSKYFELKGKKLNKYCECFAQLGVAKFTNVTSLRK